MPQHLVLIGFNEAGSNTRHEADEIATLSHIPDLADLLANGTVRDISNDGDALELTQRLPPREDEESE